MNEDRKKMFMRNKENTNKLFKLSHSNYKTVHLFEPIYLFNTFDGSKNQKVYVGASQHPECDQIFNRDFIYKLPLPQFPLGDAFINVCVMGII